MEHCVKKLGIPANGRKTITHVNQGWTTSSLQVGNFCADSRALNHCRGKSPCDANAASGNRPPTAPGGPRARKSRLAFSHPRKKNCWTEHQDHPAVLVTQSPAHLSQTCQRHPISNRMQPCSPHIFRGTLIEFALNAGGGWRGYHTRQIKPNRSETTQQPIISTPDKERNVASLSLSFQKHRI